MKTYEFLKPVFFCGLLLLLSSSMKAQQLEDYLQLAGENNPGLRAAKAAYEADFQQIDQVKALPDPNLSVSAFGKMEDARISLMQQFPWFGSLQAREEETALRAEAGYQGYLDKQNEVHYQVAQSYFRLFLFQKQAEFLEESRLILDDLKELSLARMRAGEGALAEVLRIDLLRNENQTQLKVLELDRRPVQAQFNVLVGREVTEEAVLPDSLSMPMMEDMLLERDLSANPRLREAGLRLNAASYNRQAVRKESLPRIGVGLDLMLNQRMMMEDRGDNVLMPMLSVSLPIFRKKYHAAAEEARLREEGFSLQVEELSNQLEASLASVIAEVEKTREMTTLYEQQQESLQQVLQLALTAFRNGEGDLQEILSLRQELLEYQLKAVEAEVGYFTRLAEITYLTGNSLER